MFSRRCKGRICCVHFINVKVMETAKSIEVLRKYHTLKM